jgi:hypothetical protein
VLALLTAGFCSYYRMFTGISQYDDDGWLLITLRPFLHGGRLYDEVYTQYGPFYYFVHWIVYKVGGIPVTHDSERMVAVVLWLLAAILWARVAHLLTGSLLWSGFGFLLSLKLLGFFHWSAGHPEEICIVLLAAVGILVCGFQPGTGRRMSIALGALVAALILTKVNIGLFAGMALGVLFIKLGSSLPGRRVFEIAIGAAACLMPVALMFPIWQYDWVRAYGFAATVAIGAAILINTRTEPLKAITGQFIATCVASMFVCCALILAPFLLTGTTLGAILDLTVLVHVGKARSWFVPALRGNLSIAAGIGSVSMLFLFFLQGRRGLRVLGSPFFARWSIFGLKFMVGLTGMFGLVRPTRMIFNICIPFAWLLLVGLPEGTDRRVRIGRIGLCFIVVFTYLYAFPVGGSQVDFACVPAAILALVLFRDAMLEIAGYMGSLRVPLWIGMACAVLLLTALFGREISGARRTYFEGVPLAMPGADRVRVDREVAARYRWIVSHLGSCERVYSMPGQFSLNFWSHRESPTPLNLEVWFSMFTPTQQQNIINDFQKYPDMCVVSSPWLVDFWNRGQDLSQSPLAVYIQREFVPIAESDQDSVLKRRGAVPTSAVPQR